MSTLYEIVIGVAQNDSSFATKNPGVVPKLRLGESKTGALMGDISTLVTAEADRRFPDQQYKKVPFRIGGNVYMVRVYPEYMVREFIHSLVKEFLDTHEVFDAAGEVIYARHVPTAEERQARTEAKLKQKYGVYIPHFSSRQPTSAAVRKGTAEHPPPTISFKVTRKQETQDRESFPQ